ncbi:metal ABC transporter solute-binding protein, Zn/Mn family [Frondihabitans cladoniiphilus]|uniref:Zinc ABC transporter substrate-binding protein n=1 Tax=Frondihabitans cladoniiphilus TaxID=715785 RepID=A0ABP8WBM4_9MICO
MKSRLLVPLLATTAVAAFALTGCSSSSPGAGAASGGAIRVVASTDVYGDIASQIGGKAVSVTSILTNPNQDPHGFEADAQTQLAISKAQLVVENGGGYDDYVDTMRSSVKSKAPLVNAVDVSGFKAVDGDLNEHVFYDYPTMTKVANAIAAQLAKIDPAESSTFFSHAATFKTAMGKLEAQTAALKTTYAGQKVTYTEPVPGYLFDSIGLVNATPAAFSEAVEAGNDVPPAALNDMLKLLASKEVKLLAFNEQASSPEATEAQKAAEKAGLAVVPVTETLPKGEDYEAWQQRNVDAIKAALSK